MINSTLMPGMTKAVLARELRENTAGLPGLIVSGYAEADGIASDLPRLTKPFRNADLVNVLRVSSSEVAGGGGGESWTLAGTSGMANVLICGAIGHLGNKAP